MTMRMERVHYSAVWPDGSLMYPGVWVELWVLVCPTVWMLVATKPEEPEVGT